MESDSCAQQREQESLLAVICKSLKEEHQAELQKLQRQMAQVQEKQESKNLQAHKETWCCIKADMVRSVVTGESESSSAARAGGSAGTQRGRPAPDDAGGKREQP